MTFGYSIVAETPRAVLTEVREHYAREVIRLELEASRSHTVQSRRERQARAHYARQQRDFWGSITILSRP